MSRRQCIVLVSTGMHRARVALLICLWPVFVGAKRRSVFARREVACVERLDPQALRKLIGEVSLCPAGTKEEIAEALGQKDAGALGWRSRPYTEMVGVAVVRLLTLLFAEFREFVIAMRCWEGAGMGSTLFDDGSQRERVVQHPGAAAGFVRPEPLGAREPRQANCR